MINKLSLKNVGPSANMELQFGERLNIITGDNGLGKTFVLDACWYALTRTWAGNNRFEPMGRGTREDPPKIEYTISGKTGSPAKSESRFDFSEQEWIAKQARPSMPGLVIYARIDGGFSVWDPARNYWRGRNPKGEDSPQSPPGPGRERPRSYDFTKTQVWEGVDEETIGTRTQRKICNGLIHDVDRWRLKEPEWFDFFQKVLNELSPHESEKLIIGESTRVSLDDVREIPTLTFPYGAVPISHAASGVKRVLAFAYLLVWALQEHLLASKTFKQTPTNRIVILFDEVEAHLHPQWQRRIGPAILRLMSWTRIYPKGACTQFICSTHSPIILGSLEAGWKYEEDQLIDLELQGKEVCAKILTFAKLGTPNNWLTSPSFELQSAYPTAAENAIARADAFMKVFSDPKEVPENEKERMITIHKELKKALGGEDEYFGYWLPYYRTAGGPR